MTEVYALNPEPDNPLYDRFQLHRIPSLLGNDDRDEDFGPDSWSLGWAPNKLLRHWETPEVRGSVSPYNDYPTEFRAAIFSERALAALHDLLEPFGEILPLKTKVGAYFAYNLQVKSESLDLSKAEVEFGEGKETAFRITRYAFHEEKLNEHPIFRLREYPQQLYVTDVFKERVDANGLLGMELPKVWPLPPEDFVWADEKRLRRIREKNVAPLKAQSMYVRFGFPRRMPNDDILEAGEAIELDLTEFIAISQPTVADFKGAFAKRNAIKNRIPGYAQLPQCRCARRSGDSLAGSV